jgi:hypothetical protein
MLRSIRSIWQSVDRKMKASSLRRRSRTGNAQALESRTLLASLVSATKISYQDADGDNVTVTLSKAVLTAGNVNSIFTFDIGTVDGSNTTKQQLKTINLVGVAGIAGTTITTAAVRSSTTGGDGFAALGQINATGIDIGAVTIDGDLGRILAGDATTTTQGLGALKVHSMGRYGTLSGATNLDTVIQGKLASLTTKSDVKEAFINVQGGVNGQIGTVTIGGSLIGGVAGSSGSINAGGDIGAVTVTGDMVGSGGSFTGRIATAGKLTSATIGGSIWGGTGASSGLIFSSLDMGAVKVTGDVTGAAGSGSGRISTVSKLASATIGGSLKGGAGLSSGQVYSKLDMGEIKVSGSLLGGSASSSDFDEATGAVITDGKLSSLTVGGEIRAGDGDYSATVYADLEVGPVKVTGSVIAGIGQLSGSILTFNGKMGSVTLGGSLIGGNGSNCGRIESYLDMGPVTIGGDIVGGSSSNGSGQLICGENMGTVTIGGSLFGGSGTESGTIRSGNKIGAMKIGGDIRGGTGSGARIEAFGNVTGVTVGGSLIGGSAFGSGFISVGELGSLIIEGNIVGGSASGSSDLQNSGCVLASRISTVTLNGSLIAGTDNTSGMFSSNGAIRAKNDIASLTIKGSVIGNSTSKALISARGRVAPSGTIDLAIGKLTINGRVEYGLILAGVDGYLDVTSSNADAQIGPVVIGGDWIASSLVAGAAPGVDGHYGNADDVKMSGGGIKDVSTVSSKITSIVIGGQVMGTPALVNDHFGFVAENIGSFKVKGGTTNYSLIAGNSNDDIVLSLKFGGLLGDDTRLNEI